CLASALAFGFFLGRPGAPRGEPGDPPRGLEVRVADAVDEERRGLVLHAPRAEGGELEYVDLGLDADLLEIAHDRFGGLGMVGDAAGEAVELGLEAVREA